MTFHETKTSLVAKWQLKEASQSLLEKAATKLKTMIVSGDPRKKRKLSNKTVILLKAKNWKVAMFSVKDVRTRLQRFDGLHYS